MARHSPGTRPGVLVAALTAAALAVVGFFAYQAAAGGDRPLAAPDIADSATGQDGEAGGSAGGGEEAAHPLPADSGDGRRLVYSLEQRRVWLVDYSADSMGEVVTDTFEVYPGTVDPQPGEYVVTARSPELEGSDGTPVVHVVTFHVADDGTVFGFSAPRDGSVPGGGEAEDGSGAGHSEDSDVRTGGIRQSGADSTATWDFANINTPVVVVA